MKPLALCFVVLGTATGCTGGDDVFYPVITGAPTLGIDEPGGTGSGATAFLEGRVCRATDILDLSLCAPTAGGLTVVLGDSIATTATDGSFTILRPSGSLLAFEVSGIGAVTTTTPFSPSLTVPVIDADVFARSLASNAIFLPPGTGAILGTVVRGGARVSGVTVRTTPVSPFGAFYDANPEGFTINGTGARGVFFVPGITTGVTDLAFRDPVGGATLVNGISVINGGVTILDSVVLP